MDARKCLARKMLHYKCALLEGKNPPYFVFMIPHEKSIKPIEGPKATWKRPPLNTVWILNFLNSGVQKETLSEKKMKARKTK